MNHQIKRAVAAAIALGAAGGASAFDVSGYTGAPLYISGSTAINAALLNYFTQSLSSAQNPCDITQPIDVYTSSSAGKKFTAFACVPNSSLSFTNTVQLVAIQEQNGGSFNAFAVDSGGNAANLVYPVLSSLNSGAATNCGTATVHAATSDQAAYNSYTCANFSTTTVQPTLGFADVEASIFGTTINTAVPAPSISLDFGVGVTVGLYHALQNLEGLGNDDTLANMPSLSKANITSVLTGVTTSWSQIVNASNNTSAGAQSVVFGPNGGYNSGVATNPVNTNVYVCRRDDHSGTEKTNEIVFGNLNCSTGAKSFVQVSAATGFKNTLNANANITATHYAQSTGGTWTKGTVANHYNDGYVGQLTFAGGSTGDVLACLGDRDSVGEFGIGIASLDNSWGSTQGTANKRDWRPVKIDGVVPSIENVAANRYPVWAQSTLYTGTSPGGDAGSLQTFMSTGNDAVGAAASIQAVDDADQWGQLSTNSNQGPAFDGGILGIPGNGTNAVNTADKTQTQFRANPVNSYVKATGGTVNNCQTPESASTGTNQQAAGLPTWATPL
jgi:hypothetical protein